MYRHISVSPLLAFAIRGRPAKFLASQAEVEWPGVWAQFHRAQVGAWMAWPHGETRPATRPRGQKPKGGRGLCLPVLSACLVSCLPTSMNSSSSGLLATVFVGPLLYMYTWCACSSAHLTWETLRFYTYYYNSCHRFFRANLIIQTASCKDSSTLLFIVSI